MNFKKDIIISSNEKKLKRFYSSYGKIFTLPEERESYSGFRKIMSFNGRKDLIAKYGFFEEMIISYTYNQEVIAAVNFAVYSTPNFIQKNYKINGTSHIIYIFVNEKYRKHGLGTKLVLDAEKTAEKISKGNVLFFIDVNNPLKMSSRQKIEDKKAGISEKNRILWWGNRGFRKLHFNFILPPLEDKPCRYLMLAAKTNKTKIPSDIIREHLERFFSISVLKGKDAETDFYFKREENELNKNRFILTKILS